jgi:hypothetical protein
VSQTAIACGPGVVDSLKEKFNQWGFDLHEVVDVDDSFLTA